MLALATVLIKPPDEPGIVKLPSVPKIHDCELAVTTAFEFVNINPKSGFNEMLPLSALIFLAVTAVVNVPLVASTLAVAIKLPDAVMLP